MTLEENSLHYVVRAVQDMSNIHVFTLFKLLSSFHRIFFFLHAALISMTYIQEYFVI
jgi:hypothetical protein